MTRIEALKKLSAECRNVPAGQAFSLAYYQSADGPGVARLFYAVYGDGYPVDTYYIPELLSRGNQMGDIRSVVARTEAGDIVSHVALVRSSAPNPHLYELAVGLTLREYRSRNIFSQINELALQLVGRDGIDGFFGEAVCNHTMTQKLAVSAKAPECAVEPALMPAEAYTVERTSQGRVGCLVVCRVANNRHQVLHLPPFYREQLIFILDGLGLDRELLVSDAAIPAGHGELQVVRIDFAAIARCHVQVPGHNLKERIAEVEASLRNENFILIQYFVDLSQTWSAALVRLLWQQGYSFGGLLPIWFGGDALLMQKHFIDPDFQGMKILNERGRSIVDMVRTDWEDTAKAQ